MVELFTRLLSLERAFTNRGNLETELLKYFPVALVACLEGYFRLAIKELVDAGPPYLNRSRDLVANAKIDFEIFNALHGKRITIGEFIAHSVSLSELSLVNRAMSILLDKSMLTELRTVADRANHEVMGNPKTPILSDPDHVYAAVSNTFEMRHVICHEMATNFEVVAEDVERGFAATVAFLKAADELVKETLYPNAPLTQFAMNKEAYDRLGAALQEVKTLNDELRDRLDSERAEQLSAAHEVWLAYMETWARFEADRYKGGTVWPTIYGHSAAAIARDRVDELRRQLSSYDR